MAALQRMAVHEMSALNGEDDSDDMELSQARDVALPRSGHRRVWPMILGGVLGMAALAAIAPWQSSKPQVQLHVQAEPEEQPRFLESEDLLDTILEHSLRFHDEMGGESRRLGQQGELKQAARDRLHDMLDKVKSHSPEVGRLLSDLRLTKEQWGQSKQILNALHDKRVQHIGEVVREAAGQGQSPAEVAAKVGANEEELRKLRDELIPEAVRGVANLPAGQNHWGFAMQNGAFHAQGQVGGWQGGLTVGGSETARRLQAPAPPPRAATVPPAGDVAKGGMDKGQLLYLIITASIASILGIVSTILTLTLGPAAASVLFIVTAGLDAVLCGASLGLQHLPHFNNVITWVPCMVLTSFTGLEAIWTYRKGGVIAGAVAGLVGAAPTTTTTTFAAGP